MKKYFLCVSFTFTFESTKWIIYIIIDDFYININNDTAYTMELTNIFSSTAMKQLISFDTRVTELSSTKKDLLYSTSD